MVEGEDRGLGDLFDPAGMDALCTDGDATYLTVNPGSYFLEVGSPESLSFIVGVADVVSHGPPLTAD